MGNFNNVSMGNGVLKWDGVDIGYLKGDVTYTYNYEIEDFKTGIPLMLRGSITREIVSELRAPFAEITAENVAMILGGLSITTTPATEVDVSTDTLLTFAVATGDGLQSIKLQPNLNSTSKKPVVMNTAKTVTYTEYDDYLTDFTTGKIYRNPNGIITSLQTVCVDSYSYTPAASKQVKLGTQFSLAQKSLEFIHTSPVTGKIKKVYMPLATSDGKVEMPFSETAFIIINATFKAVFDESNPTYPLGYYYEET